MDHCKMMQMMLFSAMLAGCHRNSEQAPSSTNSPPREVNQPRKASTLVDKLSDAATRSRPFSAQEIQDFNKYCPRNLIGGELRTNAPSYKLTPDDLNEIAQLWERNMYETLGYLDSIKAVSNTNGVFAMAFFPSKYRNGITYVFLFKPKGGSWQSWGVVMSRFDLIGR